MALNMSPSQLDPVFAADTPITPDPPVRAAARPQTTKPRYDQSHRDRVAELVAQGYSPAEATALAARELARAHIDSHATPPSPPPAPPAPTPPDMEPMTAQQLRDMGYNPYTEPGVNMPDGSKAEGPQQLMNEREAAAYNVRTPNGPGWYNPSGRDKAMMARGYVPVENQDGTVSYRLGPGGEVDGLPGTPGRGGRREDLEAPLMKADGTPVQDEQGNTVPRFRVDNMSGPLSENNSVYVQSKQARAKQDAYRRERQLYRDAEIQGVSPAALLAANPGDYGDLTAGGQRDRVDARAANEGARQAAAAKREEAWRAQMMLGGGRPTGGIGGSKAVVNALESLPEDQRNSSLRYMLPGGQLAAAVDGRTNEQLAELGLRTATGRGFQQPDPRLVDGQVDELKRRKREADPVEAGREDLAAGKVTSPLAMKEADRLAEQYDSGDEGVWWLGGRDGMSDQDEANLAEALVRDYGMDETLARETARRAADRRRWFRKRGPMAPAAPTGKAPPPAGR